jgi:hypothetical protein
VPRVASAADSPWQRALGDDFERLHPRLHAYFAAIPPGRVGRGEGTFDRVGTPRRWFWPALLLLQRRRILFPVWERDVPFTIENRAEAGALRAVRTFHLRSGVRVMADLVAFDGSLVDRLGDGGRLRARLVASVVEGELQLVSTSTHWGWIPLPFAPRVRLTERFDDTAGRQHVALRLESPVLGCVYEYSGYFDYRIEAE